MTVPVVVVALVHKDRSMKLGSVSIDEPPGSLSSDEPDGTRRVYLFGWHQDQRGLWESKEGYDLTNATIREVGSLGLIRLSDLDEPYDLTIHRNGQPRPLRFAASAERPH